MKTGTTKARRHNEFLAQWREGREDAIIALLFQIFTPVIPAKAGIQTITTKPATRNQL